MTVLTGLTTLTAYFGIEFGKRQAAQNVNIFLTQVLQAVPPDQRAQVAPVIGSLQQGTQQSVRGGDAADASAAARAIGSLVRAEPVSQFLPLSDVFSLDVDQTALICASSIPMTYKGLNQELRRHDLRVGGWQYLFEVGTVNNHGGTSVTLLALRDGRPVFRVACG